MKKGLGIVVFIVLGHVLFACKTQRVPETTTLAGIDTVPLSLKSRAELHLEIANKPEGDNLVWSAASLDSLLALVGFGYTAENQALLENYLGQTIDKTAEQSAFLNTKSEGVQVQSANNVWINNQYKFLAGYEKSLSDNFGGLTPLTMDVGAPVDTANKINLWISDNTSELINDVIQEDMIDENLLALLVNALYFKGAWKEKFENANTKDATFKATSKAAEGVTEVQVPMMTKFNVDVENGFSEALRTNNVTVIRLPYKGETHAMYIAFANEETTKNSEEFGAQRVIGVDTSKDVMDVYNMYIVSGEAFNLEFYADTCDEFKMPKFEIETKLEGIQNNFKSGSYNDLFKEGALAQMTDDRRAKLSFILQKAKIIVNEEGSEAAAVTVGGIGLESIKVPKFLYINGPFAYAIRDEANKVTLFEGVVRNPLADDR
ncbi:MAG: serpin family protein [Oligoflexales bacterium]|nr:serpin family protein [Oligoflexales bacterium]